MATPKYSVGERVICKCPCGCVNLGEVTVTDVTNVSGEELILLRIIGYKGPPFVYNVNNDGKTKWLEKYLFPVPPKSKRDKGLTTLIDKLEEFKDSIKSPAIEVA